MDLEAPTTNLRTDVTKYWSLLWQLISLVDTGRYSELSIEDVKRHARGGAISVLLGEVLRDIHGSHAFAENDWNSFNEEMARMANATDLPQRVKLTNNGIALLMAWAVEGIQRQE
jgi:hypothetical protein